MLCCKQYFFQATRRSLTNDFAGYSQDDARRAAEQIRRLSNLEFYALSVNELSNMNYLAELVGSSQNVFAGTETEDLKHLILNRLHCRF